MNTFIELSQFKLKKIKQNLRKLLDDEKLDNEDKNQIIDFSNILQNCSEELIDLLEIEMI